MRLLVGISGGVDSSYALLWAKNQGFEVSGCVLEMQKTPIAVPSREALRRAQKTCEDLDVAFIKKDVTADFENRVIAPFLEAYQRGLTPNPCTLCNRELKVSALLDVADDHGIEWVATGHYARLNRRIDGCARIARGRDRAKDQSYFLARLAPDQIARLVFPLASEEKKTIRARSVATRLPAASARDSEGVCFAPGGDYRALLLERSSKMLQPGPIVSEEGETLGIHKGVAFYTVGQRKGLGLSGGPWFITELVPEKSIVRVSHQQPRARRLRLANWQTNVTLSWISQHDIGVQTHYRSPAFPAQIEQTSDFDLLVTFLNETPLASPGQSAVLYASDVIVGEGTIETVEFEYANS